MLIGRRINDRYKVIRKIGGGGMAYVYLARDMILERDVAIKILRLDFAHEDEFIRRFQREAQSATSLTHENIVSIYDIGEEDDIYYIVMEYVDGMTLKQYIQQYDPIPTEKAIDIMIQLTSAVEHAHENQIIHRDIKPQNILINHHGHVMITDFGIAMALSATSITQTNSVLGSVHYLSPEQARGGMATIKSDIYSLGIVMFELLTGRLPFSGESAVSIALKHLQSETPSPRRWNEDIPQSVENIVLKATAKDPFLRYNSAEELMSDLQTALDPNRKNDPKFEVPEDLDATKAIPVLVGANLHHVDEETLAHHKNVPKTNEVKPVKTVKEKPKQEKKKRKKWPWIVSSLLLLIALFVIFMMFILPMIRNAQIVKVPDLTGYKYEDALVELMEHNLQQGKEIRITDEDIEEGNVIRTDPKADGEVKKGSLIDIFVSTGKEKYQVKNYIDRQYDNIFSMLDEAGFSVVKEEEFSEKSPGTIIDQSIDAGEEIVAEDTEIVLTVSKGVEKVSVKNLIDYNIKGLENYEETSGLNIEYGEEEYSDSIAEGLVMSQSPVAGEEVEMGSTVTVVLSKGPEEIPIETVTKTVTIEYSPEQTNNGQNNENAEGNNEVKEKQEQEIKIFIEDVDHRMTTPAETFTITETLKKDLKFKIRKGEKAGYKIIRDNTVIAEEEIPFPGE